MNKTITNLKEWGCDVDGALERLAGDEGFYADCLKMFVEDDNYDNLKKALADGEYEAAFEYAHTLKGVAGNLGITPIYDRVCSLVEPLRAKDYSDLENQFAAVSGVYDKFMEIIDK